MTEFRPEAAPMLELTGMLRHLASMRRMHMAVTWEHGSVILDAVQEHADMLADAIFAYVGMPPEAPAALADDAVPATSPDAGGDQ